MSVPKLLKTAVVMEPKGKHLNTVIFLHGLGDEGASFTDVFEAINLPNTRVVLPNAPKRPITCNGGYVMPGWYDIYQLGSDRLAGSKEDEEGINASTAALTELITSEVAKVAGPDRVVIGGFSQGAAMTMHTALRYPDKLGGVVAASGYGLLLYKGAGDIVQKETPMLVYHGVNDPVVPVSLARLTQEFFKKHCVNNVEYVEEQGLTHSLSRAELDRVGKFLRARLQ